MCAQIYICNITCAVPSVRRIRGTKSLYKQLEMRPKGNNQFLIQQNPKSKLKAVVPFDDPRGELVARNRFAAAF